MTNESFQRISVTPSRIGRRNMLRGSSAGALAPGALAATAFAASTSPADAPRVNEVAILTFSLDVVYLEAQFFIKPSLDRDLQTPTEREQGRRTR